MAVNQLLALHPELRYSKATTLTGDVSAGTNVACPVENTGYGSTRPTDDVFANTELFVFGYPGQSTTELAKINAAVSSRTSIQVDDLEHPHGPGTPITYSDWDQIELFGATSENGSYVSLYSSTPKNISWHLPYTILEYSGTTYTYAKWKYYNSVTATYSSFSPAVAFASGLIRGSLRWLIYRIRKWTKLPEHVLSDDDLVEIINDEQIFIYNELFGKDLWFAETELDITTVSEQYRYALPSDFSSVNQVIYNQYESATQHTRPFLTEIPMEEMFRYLSDQNQTTDDHLRYYALENNTYINIWPIPTTAGKTIYLYYNAKLTELTTDTQRTILPDPTLIIDRVCMRMVNFAKNINVNEFSARYERNLLNIRRQKWTNRRQPKR